MWSNVQKMVTIQVPLTQCRHLAKLFSVSYWMLGAAVAHIGSTGLPVIASNTFSRAWYNWTRNWWNINIHFNLWIRELYDLWDNLSVSLHGVSRTSHFSHPSCRWVVQGTGLDIPIQDQSKYSSYHQTDLFIQTCWNISYVIEYVRCVLAVLWLSLPKPYSRAFLWQPCIKYFLLL